MPTNPTPRPATLWPGPRNGRCSRSLEALPNGELSARSPGSWLVAASLRAAAALGSSERITARVVELGRDLLYHVLSLLLDPGWSDDMNFLAEMIGPIV